MKTVKKKITNAKYDWEAWFSRKKAFTVKSGVDFTCRVYSMVIQFRQQAHKRGAGVHIRVNDDGLVVKIYSPGK